MIDHDPQDGQHADQVDTAEVRLAPRRQLVPRMTQGEKRQGGRGGTVPIDDRGRDDGHHARHQHRHRPETVEADRLHGTRREQGRTDVHFCGDDRRDDDRRTRKVEVGCEGFVRRVIYVRLHIR